MMHFNNQNFSWLAVVGLLWDFVGALYLAKAVFVTDEEFKSQSLTYWDMSIPALRAFVEQRRDLIYSVGHLLAGFILQALAAMGGAISDGLAALMAVPLPLIIINYLHNNRVGVAAKCLKIGPGPDALESVWRTHFTDLSPGQWMTAKRRSAVRFAAEPKPATP